MRILEGQVAPQGITLNRLMERTKGRGLYLVIILLCLPFVVPLSIPGVSTVLGGIIVLLGVRLALNKPPRLPEFLGEHKLPSGLQQKILGGGLKFLRFIEKFARPRRTNWLTWRSTRFGNALLMVFMAFLLALPLPPIPPFTNALPSYAIILISVSMMEEDGLMIWLGYAMSLGTTIYFAVAAGVIATHLGQWWQTFLRLLQSTQ